MCSMRLYTVQTKGSKAGQKELTMTTAQRDTTLAANNPAIRSFRVDVPEADLSDLHRRIAATRWLDRFAEIVDELMAVLEEGERALALVPGTGQSRPPDGLMS